MCDKKDDLAHCFDTRLASAGAMVGDFALLLFAFGRDACLECPPMRNGCRVGFGEDRPDGPGGEVNTGILAAIDADAPMIGDI